MSHIDISSSLVTAIPIKDCLEDLVSVKGHLAYGPPPECNETKDSYHFVRRSVLERLLIAQKELPPGLALRLYEGYRSPEFQETLFQQQLTRVASSNPGYSEREAYKAAACLVAPTKTFEGEILSPPHSTGGAVDVEIVDDEGKVIDFGMEIKDWIHVAPSLCETEAPNLSSQAAKNRAMLVSVMSKAGFVNYSREWWHFSFGDQYWAFIKDEAYALYASTSSSI
ncbi:M15 family metallopeptidase [Vibrio maritimus]|uniref:M15 family metallopeptidase n=1 Tax=Vibrio maritimus TaxID=990268 RepID=UPI0040677D41